MLQAMVSRGVGVFHVEMDGENPNTTHTRLSRTIQQARQVI